MITAIYIGIVAVLLVFIVWNMLTEKDLMLQIDAALIMIPLLLRLFLVK